MNIIEFHNRLIDKAKDFFNNNNIQAGSEKLITFLLLHYLVKSYKLVKGINSLCKEHLESNSKILLRSLFEAFLLSAYIADDPEDITRAEDCAIRALIEEKTEIENLKNLGFLDMQTIDDVDIKKQLSEKQNTIDLRTKTIMKDYKESLDKLRNRTEYSNLSDKDIQKKFEREIDNRIIAYVNKKYEKSDDMNKNVVHKYYATVYRDTSTSIHCNDLWSHVIKNQNGNWEIFVTDSSRYTNIILITSANLFIEIMHNVNKILNLKKDLLINELYREYINIENFE